MTDLLQPIPEDSAGSPPEFSLATVASVGTNGIRLIFDGQSQASQKEYKCNTQVTFSAGDRVKIFKDSGTYIVEYPVGAPGSGGGGGGGEGQLPAGGTAGQVLAKTSGTDYAVGWTNMALTSGTYNVTLQTTVLTPSSNLINLGSPDYPFNRLYALGDVHLGKRTSTLAFFGAIGGTRQTVADDASVATLITALKAYGLIY